MSVTISIPDETARILIDTLRGVTLDWEADSEDDYRRLQSFWLRLEEKLMDREELKKMR